MILWIKRLGAAGKEEVQKSDGLTLKEVKGFGLQELNRSVEDRIFSRSLIHGGHCELRKT